MKSDMPRIYSYYGCRLQSEWPLSYVPECMADDSPPDVILTRGEAPETLTNAVWSSPFISIAADGTALIELPEVARFLLKEGRTITVQPAPGAALVDVETFLIGPVAGILLHQRGVLPLHASCVAVDGAAIALTGAVGSGKSTFATALVRKGAAPMSDDICPVVFCGDGAPLAIPGPSCRRLWPDTREAFGCGGPAWAPIRPGHAKQIGPAEAETRPVAPLAPLRLGAVIRLVPDHGGEAGIRRLRGLASVAPLKDIVYRFRLGRALGRGEALFGDAMRLAGKTPIFEVRRPEGFEHLERMADAILECFRVRGP